MAGNWSGIKAAHSWAIVHRLTIRLLYMSRGRSHSRGGARAASFLRNRSMPVVRSVITEMQLDRPTAVIPLGDVHIGDGCAARTRRSCRAARHSAAQSIVRGLRRPAPAHRVWSLLEILLEVDHFAFQAPVFVHVNDHSDFLAVPGNDLRALSLN